MTPIIQTRGLRKVFGASIVVRDVSLRIDRGEVVGLVGPNGSGKSTLLHMLSGSVRPEAGTIVVDGVEETFDHPSSALRRGIGMLAQEPDLCPHLSVAENIFLGQEPSIGRFAAGIIDWRGMISSAKQLLREAGNMEIDVHQAAGTLSGGQKKLVTLARLMARDTRVVLLDEPTASLGEAQKALTLEFVAARRASDCAVLLITHDREEIRSYCSRVVAMQRGRVVDDFLVSDTLDDRLTRLLTVS